MLKLSKDSTIPSVDNIIGILKAYNQLMPIFIDFDKLCQYITWYQIEIDKLAGPLFECLKGVRGRDKPSTLLINWLVERGEDLSVFGRTKTGISLKKDSIAKAIESRRLSDDAVSVINVYQLYMNYSKTKTTLVSLLQFPIVNAYSYDGHRMIMIVPGWRGQNTGRVAMYDPALQNLPRGCQDLFTVPKGWRLIHTDSGQVEPRIIYSAYIPDPQIQTLIKLYNDAYFGLLHYCTMPESDITTHKMDFEKMEITDTMKENRKQIKTYGNAVMYGSKSNPKRDPIKDAMINRIGNHPMRLAWIEKINWQIDKGNFIFKTWFGTPIDISKSEKLAQYDEDDTEGIKYELVKLGINNPIQGTAADLMRVSCAQAYSLLSREAKDSVILSYVHDAGMFAVYEDDYPKVAEQLKDIVAYDIDGWIPIYAEPEEGREGGKNGIFPDLY